MIYEDKNILVINKQSGLEVYDLEAELKKEYRKVHLAHRLDKDTSGLIILAKNEKSYEWIKEQFKERLVKKTYRAIASGVLKPEAGRPTGTISAPIGRHPRDARKRVAGGHATGEKREAITHYKILENLKNHTYLEVRPQTGRTHQIRVHLQYVGHPILGDKLYAPSRKSDTLIKRQMLHAYKLKFVLPDGKEKDFTAPLPSDFKKVLAELK